VLSDTVRVAGIYGANAAGKSNVLDAMAFLAKAADFVLQDVRHTYGFEVDTWVRVAHLGATRFDLGLRMNFPRRKSREFFPHIFAAEESPSPMRQ
jgi:predicted ATPase